MDPLRECCLFDRLRSPNRHVPLGTSRSWLWNMTPENPMFHLEQFVAARGTWAWNGESTQRTRDCPVGRALARLYHRAHAHLHSPSEKSNSLYTVMASNMAPFGEGPMRRYIRYAFQAPLRFSSG